MSSQNTAGYIIAAKLRARFGNISDMTLWRWLHDPALNFPQPIWINGRRYWRESEILAWEQSRPRKQEAA